MQKRQKAIFIAYLSFFVPIFTDQRLYINRGLRDGIPNKIRVRQYPIGFRIAKSVSCKKSRHLSLGQSVKDVRQVKNNSKEEI